MKFVFSPILLFLSIFIVSSKHTETKTHTNKHANEASVFAANCGDTSIGTPTPPCNSTAGCLGGQSFEDFNRNGRNDIHEYGVAGVEVHLFDGRGNPVGMTITDAEGDWQVCNLTDGAPYRVEFRLPTSLSCWATPTQVGADGRSDVQIRTVPDCAYFGLSNAQDYCQENPTVYVPCFVNGEAGAGGTADGLDALVGFDYQSNGEPGSADYTGDPTHLAFLPEIGATWGMAYDRFERRIFTSAVLKRHSGFGPLGTGGIYVADLDISSTFGNYIDLQTLGVNTGADPRTPYDGLPLAANELPADADEPNWDVDAFAQIGKIGIGGMAISEDGQQLYLLNLHNKTLVMLDISSNSPSLLAEVAIPIPAGVATDDFFAWAVEVHNGKIYVGAINAATTTQQASDLNAYVLTYDGTTWQTIFDTPLDYDRRDNTNSNGSFLSNWQPWTDTFRNQTPQAAFWMYPQPIVTSLVITERGDLVIGLADRHGLQSGSGNYPPVFDQRDVYAGIAAGDILKACWVGTGYALENNGACGGVISDGANNGDGPNGGEFYWGDQYDYQAFTTPSSFATHVETAFGIVTQLAGTDEIIATGMNPTASPTSGGIIHLNNTDGSRNQYGTGTSNTDFGYRIYYTPPSDVSTFGKAIGLGEMALGCELAPIEIGNYVWCDNIANGTQDALEQGTDGISIGLYDRAGLRIGQTTTANNGQYYFNSTNVDTTGVMTDGSPMSAGGYTGLNYNSTYYVVFGDEGQFDGDRFTIGSNSYRISTLQDVNANADDNIDSDVSATDFTTGSLGMRPDGLPFVTITTASQGRAYHSIDMALDCVPCPSKICVPVGVSIKKS